MKSYFRFTLCISLFAATWACDQVVDRLEETITSDPQRSPCQAYCEWAIGCQAEAREVDNDSLLETCLTAARASESSCEEAETEGVDVLTSELFEGCVDAIDEAADADQCEAFTGNAVEINSATPPQSCLVAGGINLFNTVRRSTAENNDELCVRVSETLCQKSTSCLEDFFNLPTEFVEMLEPPALTQCIDRFEEEVTTVCQEEQLYAIDQEESGKADIEDVPSVLFSVNASREAARECLAQLATLPCDELMSGDLPPVCAGAFSDPTTTASALNGFACGLEREELAPICD